MYRHLRSGMVALALTTFMLLGNGPRALGSSQKPEHTGTKLEGFAIVVTPESITVFDKKSQELKILTGKDYTSLVGIGAAVTVWYTSEGGVHHLEDIVYPKGGTYVPTDLIRQGIERIIILPDSDGVENTQGLMDAISKYLSDNAGWYVAPLELAKEIASRSKISTSSLDAINPDTGDVDMQRYLEPKGGLVSTIATETRSDAVLEIRVIKVKANVRTGIASWDDMTEAVASRKSRAFSPFGGLGGKGWVYAATVDMNLWGESGKLLWNKRRGLAVLGVQSGMGSKFRERPLTEVYQDGEAMRRWLAGTLGQLAPPVSSAPEEVRPLPPDIQKQLEKARKAGEEQ
ncbi:MAG: hypothetical protein P4N24_03330, partial [Acidobacteriota bacterium]|nr:hypothetical protein [Acidobacteriota bacterium]